MERQVFFWTSANRREECVCVCGGRRQRDVCVCMGVCVVERETERERQGEGTGSREDLWHVVSQLSLDADDTHTGNLTEKRGGNTQRADDSGACVCMRVCVYCADRVKTSTLAQLA